MLGIKGFAASVLLTWACSAMVVCASEDPWKNFVPPPDDQFDWLQMSSGEWLKGELKVMHSFSLEFDSDDLGLLDLDFDDVRQIRSTGNQRVLIETGRRETEVMTGRLVLSNDRVQMISNDITNDFRRGQIVSIAGGAKRERDNWSGSFSIGATLRGGNTETANFTGMANIRRRSAMNRFNMDYFGNYSAANEVDTANNHRLNGYFDWFITGGFFWQVLDAEYYRDPFVNIGDQYSVGTGVGYDLIRTPRTEWTLNTGSGYQQTRFDSVVPPDPESSESPFANFGTRLDHEVSGRVDFLYDYSARLLNETSGGYTHHMITTLSVEVIADLDLDVSFIWDRITNPQPTDDGAGSSSKPKQDDYQLVVGIGFDF